MNRNVQLVLVVALAAAAVYLFLKKSKLSSEPASTAANPTTGRQTSGPQDIFGSVLSSVQSIFSTVQTIASQGAKTT